jgi:acetate kinase
MDDMDDRVKKLEYQMWGLNGANGVVGEIRKLRQEMNEWRRAEAEKAREIALERKRDIRWRIGTAIAVVSAILVAAGIVASAL